MKKNKYDTLSDSELLDHYYQSHNNEWLGILLERYTLLLLGVSMKYLKNETEARDAVQQVFLKTISELHKYKVTYFKSWLYMVAKNHCLVILREKNKLPLEINEFHTNQLAEIETDSFENTKALDKLPDLINELNEEQRSCVTLFYLEKKSYKEITEITGYSLIAVKSYIQNGKRNLKIMLERIIKNET